MKKTLNKKENSGITLVALVVTIIILLILAGISIAAITNTGLFSKAKQAEQKSKEAQELENLTLADYENEIENISSTREIAKSQYINSLNFKVLVDMNKIEIEISKDMKDETKFLCYHYFVKNVDTNEIVNANVSQNNKIKVENLDKNTKYDVYVSAYDIEDNYIKANIQRITTLDKLPLQITDISKIYYYNTDGKNMTIKPDDLYRILFNGNTNEGGKWVGILLNPVYSDTSIKFTVNAKIKLYAYGHYYSDTYGSSGADVIIQKYNESTNTYENYKTVPTKADGKRYELLELEKGQYNMKPAGKYVNFDEWEYELIK